MSLRVLRARVAAAAVVAVTAALLTPAQGGAAAPQRSSRDTVDVSGTVLVLAGEDGEPDRYSLQLPSGTTVELGGGFSAEPLSRLSGTVALAGAGTGRTLTGSARAAALRNAEAAGAPLSVVEADVVAPAPSPGPTNHTTYVAKITNFGAIGLTDAQILAGISSSYPYWVRESGGQIPSWTTATSVVPVSSPVGSAAAGCGLGNGGADFSAIAQSVGAQAFPGVDLSGASPNHLVVVVPDGCGGTTAGRGRLGTSFASGGPVIIQAEPGAGNLRLVLEHEFGHNVSLHHANNATAEYGNLYEVMGAGPSGYPNPVLGTVYRWEQGIVGADEVVDGTAGGTWSLAARSAGSGLRSVTFIDPDTGVRHFVDYRNGTAGDAGTWYAAASSTTYYGQTYTPGIVVERDNDEAGSFLLKTPTNDGALQGNEAWTNTGGTIVVRGSSNVVTITRNTGVPQLVGGTVSMSTPTALRDVSAVASGFSPTPLGTRFQWTFNGQPIPGAEGTVFRPTVAMAGGKLGVTVTAYATGRNPTTRTTTQTVLPATWYAQGAQRAPIITGTARVGETLSVVGLDWVNYAGQKPADLTTAYEWIRGTTVIPGATGSTYRPTAADLGQRISVRESPRAAGYVSSTFATSGVPVTVAQGRLVTKKPRITGRAKVGKVVKAKAKGWTAGTRLSYQWFVGKKAIKGATRKKLTITRAMRGTKIVVKVTGKKKGYQSASSRSKPTKVT